MTNPISVAARRTRMAITLMMTWFSMITIGLAVLSTPGNLMAISDAGDPVRGKELFEKRCGGCHSLDNDKEGPRLRGVFGRKAGSVASFKYSDSMKAAGFIWDAANLDLWLTNTESVVHDNDMEFHVPKADERADIIEFLRVSGRP